MFRVIMQVPAVVAIGVWFAFQLISSIGMFSGGDGGGVAYGAHIGGFIAGVLLVKVFAPRG
jgi:membrane associated rhomboid family serine protease